MRLKKWHCLALLFITVCLTYAFSLSAGFNSVDDLARVIRLDNAGKLNVFRLFFPHGHYYYRPLGTLTFFLDRDLWGSAASFMHLENLLIHFGSAVMVFLLTSRLLRTYSFSSLVPALSAALFFAVHPLTAEAVCWISGRYDLLACFFLLTAVWLLLVALQSNTISIALLSCLFLFLACLAKEIAVFSLPGLLWLVLFSDKRQPVVKAVRERFVFLVFPVVAVAGYFLMRQAVSGHDTGVKAALKGVVVAGHVDVLDKIRIALKVYGFYFKKLFVPWPLNFGITNVSDLYVIPGVLLVLLVLWLLWRRDLLSSLAITSFCVMSPALLVVFGKMTWTPIAERYLYSSVALAAPPISLWLTSFFYSSDRIGRRWFHVSLAVVLVVFLASTMNRAWVWQDNERLYRDTAAKSPDFEPAKAELATALSRKGKNAEAEAVLQSLQKGRHSESFIVDDLNLVVKLMERGELQQARELLLPLLNKNRKKRYAVLQSLLKVNNLRLDSKVTPDEDERRKIRQESLNWLMERQKIKRSPFTLYRIAKMQMVLGENQAALESFRKVLKTCPAEAYYRDAAKVMMGKLEAR